MKTIVSVPTINDQPADFARLFKFCNELNGHSLEVEFSFAECEFLRQNAVAVLGGLSRLIESRGGKVAFDLSNMQKRVKENLEFNRFLPTFGYCEKSPYLASTVPYREDKSKDKDGLTDYLRTMWLGKDRVHLSKPLQNRIAGRMWEIYENAFEHSMSEIGIFSCGQYFPRKSTLNFTVVDFGVGIPSNVRKFNKREEILSDRALKWAFQQGTSTKPNGAGRGIGLDLLKEFVKVNRGRLEVFSLDAYVLIDENQETYAIHNSQFIGTLVNIVLRCDESFYKLASEITSDKPF